MLKPLKATDLVLSILQIADGNPVPVSALIHVGQTIGTQPNAVRVALTRLKQRGRATNTASGDWTLAAEATPVARTIRAWRLGEARRTTWTGEWLAAHLPHRAPSRTGRTRSVKALTRMGYREARSGLWVRPDCLADMLHPFESAQALGLESGAEPLWLRTRASLGQQWHRLWDVAALRDTLGGWLRAMDASSSAASDSPAYLRESLTLGRQVIAVLAFDPLLPDQIMDPEPRAMLTRAMCAYDKDARARWRRALVAAGAPLPGLHSPNEVFDAVS